MKLVPYSVTRSIGRAILQSKKNSPHLFFVAGVAGMVGTTVLACRATLKMDKQLDDIRSDVMVVKSKKDIELVEGEEAYPEKEYYRDLGRVYVRSAVVVGKLYGPSIVLGVASVGLLTGSHVQLTRRNAALTATLTAVSQAFDEYRERIRQEIGEEREREVFHGVVEEKDAKGKAVKVIDKTGISVYARIFDEQNPNWYKSAERNHIFLKAQQDYANLTLRNRGHVLLNDVYDMLGFDRTPHGAIMGWVYESDEGDSFIDFGLFEAYARPFINGQERSVILDFNFDGIIYDKIG